MKLVRTLIVSSVVLCFLAANAQATVIGTFSNARPIYSGFDLFAGQLYDEARAALAADGHTLVNLDAGIDGTSLGGVETVYLPLGLGNSILSSSEVSALTSFVASGGNLIVEGEHNPSSYQNLAAAFGVTILGFSSGDSSWATLPITGTYAGLTSGPYGNPTSLATATTGAIDPGSTSGISLIDGGGGLSLLYVLGAGAGLSSGSGDVIFLTDVNHFDDPENTGGWSQGDGPTFWRNMFGLGATSSNAPEPGSLALVALGLVGVSLGVRRRRR